MSDDLVKRARHNAQADMPHYASVGLIEEMADRIEELESGIREFFALLDKTEESDEGRVFHPNKIRSCRVVDAENLEQVLSKLKGAI